MAFFKFRKGGDDQTATAPQPESVEVMRKRARHRLIGSVVLVLLGVIGFPLLMDKQPRSVAVNVPIEIPDRNHVTPLPQPAPPPALTPAAKEPVPTPAPAVEPKAAAQPKPEPNPQPKPQPKPEPVSQPQAETGKGSARVRQPEAVSRYVVQVGAFADAAKAREVRLKVERAGLKTYTQLATTREGRRIRVRVGPFATKAEAEKAAGKIKKIDLPAVLLEL